MKSVLKAVLFGAVLCAAGVSGSVAQAGERLTLYEVNKFIKQFDQSVSSQDTLVGQSFLINNVSEGAHFETRLVVPRTAGGDYGNVYYKDHTYGVYYRYPYPSVNTPYMQEVSSYYDTKPGVLTVFQNKKIQIPGYSQKTVVEGFTMPASASKAAVDVTIREYGARYSQTYPGLIENALQMHSKCRMYLEKTRSQVQLSGLTCETISYYPGPSV